MNLISNFSTYLKPLFIVIMLLTVSGCGDLFRPTIPTICEQHPDICLGLNKDGWCRAEKAQIIRHRYEHLNITTDSHFYPLLKHYEDYEVCIEKASKIRHIKYRDKERDRMEGYLTAINAIKKISWQTRDSSDPSLQYYHWSRYSDETAKKRFLAQARKGDFNTPDLWLKVASVYLKVDNEASRKALYKALTYFDDASEVTEDIYKSLITINLDDERYASAMVWALVYSETHDEGQITLEQTKPLIKTDLNTPQLATLASKIEDAIDDGNFDGDRLGLWRLK